MNIKKLIILSLIAGLYCINAVYAQVTEEWVARYNSVGNGLDYTAAMAIDAAENVYITGYTADPDASYYNGDYLTVKFNSSGVVQWAKTYNGIADSLDKAIGIKVDNLGNVYITGSSMSNQYGDPNWVTIKYNSAGQEQWQQRYAPLAESEPSAIVLDNAGFVYVSGMGAYGYGPNYATIKYDAATGTPVWTSTADIGHWVTAMKVDNSGNVYITGYKWNDGNDYVTIKYNSAGQQQWNVVYNGFDPYSDDKASAMAIDNAGNVYVTGSSEGSLNNNDFVTVKYDSYGNQQWAARYAGADGFYDDAYAIAVDNSGNVFVTGRSFGLNTDYDYATVKYNSSGTEQWVQRYNGNDSYPGDDIPNALVLDAAGNVYVTGSTYKWIQDFTTIKYNSAGVQQWLQSYNGSASSLDAGYAIKVAPSGNVYAGGISYGDATNMDVLAIKYSQTTGINEPANPTCLNFYPNPASDKVTVNINNLNNAAVTLNIYTSTGQLVHSEPVRSNQQQLNVADLSSGMYVVEVTSPEGVAKQKLIIQR